MSASNVTYRTRKATLGIDTSGGGTFAYLPFLTVPIAKFHVTDLFPGKGNIGQNQRATQERGGRRAMLAGLQWELPGQSASGTEMPFAALLKAAGMAKSGTTGFSYSLGDPHFSSGDSQTGDCIALPAARYAIDGEAWDAANLVFNHELLLVANKPPIFTSSLYGNVPILKPDGTTPLTANVSGRQSVTAPSSVTSPTLKALPWLNSTVSVAGQALNIRQALYRFNNQVNLREGPGNSHGFLPPQLTERDPPPNGAIELETNASSVFDFENYELDGADIAVSLTYAASGASGAFSLWTITWTAIARGGGSYRDENGLLRSVIGFEQKETGGGLVLACSALP